MSKGHALASGKRPPPPDGGTLRYTLGCYDLRFAEMSRFCAILSLTFLLTACQTPAPARAQFPAGAQLVLNRPVVIPADRASVWIQDGRTASYGGLDKYRPHCRFEVRSLESRPRTVQPGTFQVRGVQREIEGLLSGAFPQVAALGMFGGGGGPSPTPYITHIYLRSAQQPDVLSLSCQRWEDPTLGSSEHLSMAEIRNALGDLFSVQLTP